MPRHPIYTALLPEAARACIGRPHRSSAPAMAMLLDEGFRYENHVDVFDAGPQVHADRERIRTVAESRLRAVSPAPAMGETHVLACTLELEDFRVVRARTTLSDGAAALDDAVQRGLQRGRGAVVRVSPSHPPARQAAA
jgi:arginine N-succinyltransferase